MNTTLDREPDERSLTTPCLATAEEIALACPLSHEMVREIKLKTPM